MRKHRIPLLVIVTAVFAAFTLGFLLGSSRNRGSVSVSVPAGMVTVPTAEPEPPESKPEETKTVTFPVDINTAEKEELLALPGIGDILAERILAYREEHGPFDAPEALMLVEGIGEKKLEAILDLIVIGG